MSLRRSARNADKQRTAIPEVTEALYQKANENGNQEANPPARAEHYLTPSPRTQAKLDTRRATTTAEDRKPSKKASAQKKAAAPRKRKASSAPETTPLESAAILTNATNLPGSQASTSAPPLKQIPSEVLQSIDVTKPVETFTIPPGSGEAPGGGPTHSHFPNPDPPKVADEPSTPAPAKRQRRKKADTASPLKPVPFMPTPSGVGLVAGSENVRKPKDGDHVLDDLASLNRPADPHATNAPVLTPNGNAVIVNESPSKKRKANDLPPDVGSPLKAGSSTVDTLLKDAEAYLIKVDAEMTGNGRLEKIIRSHHCKMFNPEGLREVVDPFTALASGIIGQQVSGAAAASIRKKFTALFEDTHPAFPSPAQVLTLDIPTLRTAGLSQRKAEYITGLAEKFASDEFTAEGLVSASDEELIDKLVAVRGLGRWSVEMFACFGLKRMDVFSTGDLGVQRGMAAYMGRDVSKLKTKGGKWKYMSEQEMLSIASKFSPYRSLFMWYMWRIADVETEVLE